MWRFRIILRLHCDKALCQRIILADLINVQLLGSHLLYAEEKCNGNRKALVAVEFLPQSPKNGTVEFSYLLLACACLCVCVCVYIYHHHHHQHHHVPEGLDMLACSLILKMKLVPPSLPRSSYVSSSVWFTL